MTNRKIDRVSRRKGRIPWLLTGVGVVAAVLVASMVLGSATVQAGQPAPTETPMPTDVPLIFVGDIAAGEPTCGGGEVVVTVTPDGTGITSLEVRNTNIVIAIEAQTFPFDPPVPIDPTTGDFTDTGEVQTGIDATIAGSFDFSASPLPTVAGSITVFAQAAPDPPLCVVTFTAEQLPVGEEPPTPAPTSAPAATPAPTDAGGGPLSPPAAVSGLPGTGSSGGSGSDGALWAIVAGVVGLFALGTAGVASLRRRRA